MPTMLITLYQPISVKSRGLSIFISFLAKNLSSGVNVLLPMVKDIRKKIRYLTILGMCMRRKFCKVN